MFKDIKIIEMIELNNAQYIEIKLFKILEKDKFVNKYSKIKYLNEFFETYKRIEIQRVIINYKLKIYKDDIYLDCIKKQILINNKYLTKLVEIKNKYLNLIMKNNIYKMFV